MSLDKRSSVEPLGLYLATVPDPLGQTKADNPHQCLPPLSLHCQGASAVTLQECLCNYQGILPPNPPHPSFAGYSGAAVLSINELYLSLI